MGANTFAMSAAPDIEPLIFMVTFLRPLEVPNLSVAQEEKGKVKAARCEKIDKNSVLELQRPSLVSGRTWGT